ncbi:condensation domain-containing protein [Aliiglaciecola sp.]|nr:condensation domain-containing protein [Aliiglaciecola sp.]
MKLKNVADIYPLSPMQETMLFHAVTRLHPKSSAHEGAGDDTLFNQVHYSVTGALDVERLQNSWQYVLQLNASLRTGFVFEGLKQPQQIVRQHLTFPFVFNDLSNFSAEQQNEELKNSLIQDRLKGFDPQKPPLMRVTLIRFRTDFYHLIWSSHHLVFDRWCIPILFEQLTHAYEKNEGADSTKVAQNQQSMVQYKQYIAWLKKQDKQKASTFWGKRLAGFDKPSRLTSLSGSDSFDAQPNHYQRLLSTHCYQSMKAFCQQNTLTLATLVQGAWTILLHEYTQQADIMYGVVVSGRPSHIPDIERIVGSFVNNLPMRSKLDGSQTGISWLRDIQRESVRQTQHDYIGLTELHQYTSLNESDELFDSILLWLAPTQTSVLDGLDWHPVSADSHTGFAYTLSIEQLDESLRLSGDLNKNASLPVPHATLFDRLEYILTTLVNLTQHTTLLDLGVRTASSTSISSISNIEPRVGENDVKAGKGREKSQVAALQEYLRYEWQQLLGTDNVDLDDDFFDLGGNSLKAAQLLKRVEMVEHKSIPLLSLFQGRTIRGMVDIIVNQSWPVSSQIAMPIKKQGSQAPLFCIASPEVNTIGYANLAHYLDADRSIYVLQGPPDKDKVTELHADQIPDLASDYIKEMETIQPQGPYHILGMCTGAQIAIEMARMVEEKQQSLGFLGVVNTWAFYTVTRWYRLQKLRNRLTYYKGRIAGRSVSQLRTELAQKRQRKKQVATTPLVTQSSAKVKQVSLADNNQHEDYYSIIDDVGWTHLLPPLRKVKQTMTVFRLKQQPYWRLNDRALGWNNQCETTHVIDLDGTSHMAIMREPHVKELAEKLAQCIET